MWIDFGFSCVAMLPTSMFVGSGWATMWSFPTNPPCLILFDGKINQRYPHIYIYIIYPELIQIYPEFIQIYPDISRIYPDISRYMMIIQLFSEQVASFARWSWPASWPSPSTWAAPWAFASASTVGTFCWSSAGWAGPTERAPWKPWKDRESWEYYTIYPLVI